MRHLFFAILLLFPIAVFGKHGSHAPAKPSAPVTLEAGLGDINHPVIIGSLYNNQDRPPLNGDGKAVLHLPSGAADSDAAHIEVSTKDKIALKISMGSTVVTIQDGDPVVSIDAGGNAKVTIGSNGAVTMESSGNVELKAQGNMNIEAAGKLTLTPDAQEIDTRHLGFTVSPHEECAVEEAQEDEPLLRWRPDAELLAAAARPVEEAAGGLGEAAAVDGDRRDGHERDPDEEGERGEGAPSLGRRGRLPEDVLEGAVEARVVEVVVLVELADVDPVPAVGDRVEEERARAADEAGHGEVGGERAEVHDREGGGAGGDEGHALEGGAPEVAVDAGGVEAREPQGPIKNSR